MATSGNPRVSVPQECVYRLLDTGIHEFVFLKPSALAVHQWAEQWGELMAGATPNQTLYALMDTSLSGMPPMHPMILRSKQLIARLPVRPPTRTAILATFHLFLSIAQDLSAPLLRNHADVVKYFGVNQRDAALEWLRH